VQNFVQHALLVGMKARFHQLYTVGHTIDCTKWKEDYKNCAAFLQSNAAADAVIISLFLHLISIGLCTTLITWTIGHFIYWGYVCIILTNIKTLQYLYKRA